MKRDVFAVLLGGTVLSGCSLFSTDQTTGNEFNEALRATKAHVDVRARYEGASFDGFAENANALTLRGRIGVETGAFLGTTALIEFDHVEALVDDYNSVLNGKGQFPVIADPEVTELNRLQLRNTSLPDTAVTLGRQRIIFDNARFVGNVGWRQDEQTYDAIRVANTSVAGVKLDAVYVDQVNRIFGDDAPQSEFESDSWLLNASYDLPDTLPVDAKVAGYAYLLDLDATQLSSQTLGGYADVRWGDLTARAEVAQQSDYAGNASDYSETYLSGWLGYAKSGFSAGVGYEELGGDGNAAFTTPLATGHKFNGFADVFLNTPADGLEDIYGTVGYKSGKVGPLPYVKLAGTYHDFSAANGNADYGSEVNAVVATKVGKAGVLLKYADYNADGFATDRQRYSVQVDFKF